jgi:mannose-6-phosphate isomerase-like protein (cupin superfamily)
MRRFFVWGVGLAVLGGISAARAQQEPVKPGDFLVVPPGGGLVAYPGEWKFTREQNAGAFSLVEINVPVAANDWRGPRHVHTREDEAWYVIDGELAFEVGDKKATVGPGTFVYAPRDIPHRYRVTKAPARYLLIFSPSGIEPLFAEVAELLQKYEEGSEQYRAELEKLQAKYGARTVRE